MNYLESLLFIFLHLLTHSFQYKSVFILRQISESTSAGFNLDFFSSTRFPARLNTHWGENKRASLRTCMSPLTIYGPSFGAFSTTVRYLSNGMEKLSFGWFFLWIYFGLSFMFMSFFPSLIVILLYFPKWKSET